MDSGCYLRNCSKLTSQMPEFKNRCTVPVTAVEDIDGCKPSAMRAWIWTATVANSGSGMDELPGGGEGT